MHKARKGSKIFYFTAEAAPWVVVGVVALSLSVARVKAQAKWPDASWVYNSKSAYSPDMLGEMLDEVSPLGIITPNGHIAR